MKRRFLSALLVMLMIVAIVPVTALAGVAEDIVVSNPTYYANGSLEHIEATFTWMSERVTDCYMILCSKPLSGGDNGSDWGAFSNFGYIADNDMFNNYNEALAYNGNEFGFIKFAKIDLLDNGDRTTIKLDLAENVIPLNKNAKYYCYFWITDNLGRFYPDNLIFVIQVQDSQLKYVAASVPTDPNRPKDPVWGDNIYRNYYNPIEFEAVKNDPGTPGVPGNPDPADPAEHPDTGDITNIPLWTALFLGGVALLWVQLSQRKRTGV